MAMIGIGKCDVKGSCTREKIEVAIVPALHISAPWTAAKNHVPKGPCMVALDQRIGSNYNGFNFHSA